jgi:hypothetical protein
MAVGSKRVQKAVKLPDAATVQAMRDADIFVSAGRDRKQAEAAYSKAKEALFLWLGPRLSGTLPDGRTLTKAITPIAAEATPRSAFDRVTLVVSPPPPATV